MMWKLILTFLLINLGFLVVLFVVTTIGHEYDKAYKLYPEVVQLSYDLSIGDVHGQRWIRFFKTALSIGTIVNVVLVFIWYRKRTVKTAELDL